MDYRIQLTMTQMDGATAVREDSVDETFTFTEAATVQMKVQPSAADKDLAPMLQELGTDNKIRALAIISDTDGVMVEVGTASAETATVGCYPFFFMGLDTGMGVAVADNFVLNLVAHSGDAIASVKMIAYA
jgi:hypothetical protein